MVQWGSGRTTVVITHIYWRTRTFDGVFLDEPYNGSIARGLDLEGIYAYGARSKSNSASTNA